ncbi:Crp/Fnr family transcriptional regulator [Aestuariibaculum sediminum]|uniref:Crp/Fnr family transcriptional regulator n=1 Tax=Aestuariibaculum sediminum TaxID=2770637 RepID=A0A8J6UBG3_9FLAO|nr:Crp/Fnr family transcriptional regulator [Aestuariibaculum sediminum]MBD0830744.1 Crp/Fnr family transcriptional regulator [Aestuariibaculum sediminum]
MNTFYSIIKEHFGELTEEEFQILNSFFYSETLSKNDFFTQSGSYCKKLSLVKTGFLRIYALSEGKEITHWISTPDYFITEISSFFFNQPSRWYIQALTPVELLTIDKQNYNKLCESVPKWKDIESQFIAKCFAILENRVFTHLSMSAEERYHLYFQENKALFNQVSLQYLASVLGMTPETFSRIRKRHSENP